VVPLVLRVKQPEGREQWDPRVSRVEEVQVKAVLWDFGGVITTSPFDAFGDYEAANGLEPGFVRRLNATNPDTNAWARLERSEVTAEEFAALFEAEAEAAGGKVDARALLAGLRGRVRPEMLEAVRRCSKQLKTGLLTNNFITGETSAEYLEVLGLFDVVIESSVVGHRKPDPRFYQMACERLAIEPTEAVFLDDLGINLKPAQEMGMRTIKVHSAPQALQELEEIVGFRLG
jgi:putative hydrolase of the HAD superfamily